MTGNRDNSDKRNSRSTDTAQNNQDGSGDNVDGSKVINPTQYHDGAGDNVAGNKTTYSSISSESVEDTLIEVMDLVLDHDIDEARKKLEPTNTLYEITKGLEISLKSLYFLCDTLQGKTPNTSFDEVNRFLNDDLSVLERSIAELGLMAFYVKNEEREAAHELFGRLHARNEHATIIYLTHIKPEKEVQALENSVNRTPTRRKVKFLIDWYLEKQEFETAINYCRRLQSFNDFRTQNVYYWKSRFLEILHRNNYVHFWLFSASDKEDILEICSASSKEMEGFESPPSVLVRLASNLLMLTEGTSAELAAVCWKKVHLLEDVNPDAALHLRLMNQRSVEGLEGNIADISRAESDKEFRDKKIEEIKSKESIDIEEFLFLKRFSTHQELRQIQHGSRVNGESESIFQDIANLSLRARASVGDKKDLAGISEDARDFVSRYGSELQNVHPSHLVDISNDLIRCDLFEEARVILETQIPTAGDLWNSPVIHSYLKASFNSDKLETVRCTLERIPERYWDFTIWQIEVARLREIGEGEKAITAAKKAFEVADTALEGWYLLVSTHHFCGTESSEYKRSLNALPTSILRKSGEYERHLVSQIFTFGDRARAEQVLMDWFVQSPQELARPLIDIAFLPTFAGSQEPERDSIPFSRELGGVVYKLEGERIQKLMVQGVVSGEHVLESDSDLAQTLLDMTPKEVRNYKGEDLELIEFQPPFQTAFQISIVIRNSQNDGSDAFRVLKIPETPEGSVDVLLRKLSALEEERPKKSSLSLYVEGKQSGDINAVKTALRMFNSQSASKFSLSESGEEEVSSLLLDAFSLSYLAVTNLIGRISDLGCSVYITQDTYDEIGWYIDEISDPNYLDLVSFQDHGFAIRDSERMRSDVGYIWSNLEALREGCRIISPGSFDVPDLAAKLGNLLPRSVYSTLRAAIEYQTPWLCMDEFVINGSQQLEVCPVNSFRLVSRLLSNTSFDERRQGLGISSYLGLPFIFFKEDFLEFLNSEEEKDWWILNGLITKIDSGLLSGDQGKVTISLIISKFLLKRLDAQGRTLWYSPLGHPYDITGSFLNNCFLRSLRLDIAEICEHRLGRIIGQCLYMLRDLRHERQVLTQFLSRFVTGHFLNKEAVSDGIKQEISEIDQGPSDIS